MKTVHVLLLAPLLCACADRATEEIPETEPALAPRVSDIANAEVLGVYDDPVRLTDGRYAGPPFESDGTMRPTVRLGDRLSAWRSHGRGTSLSRVDGIVGNYSWQQGQLMLSYVQTEFDAMYFDAARELAGSGDGG